jgi:hypothetical protein
MTFPGFSFQKLKPSFANPNISAALEDKAREKKTGEVCTRLEGM